MKATYGSGDKLTTKMRKKLPDSAFALPEKRAYPVNDRAHAAAAKSRAAQFASPAEKAKIDAKANKMLGKGKKTKGSGDMPMPGAPAGGNLMAAAANAAKQQVLNKAARR